MCITCTTRPSAWTVQRSMVSNSCKRTETHGVEFLQACHACANLTPWGSPSELDRCMQCLDTLEPVACKPDGPRDDCWYPLIDDRICYNCAQDKATGDTSVYTTEEDFNTCVACTKDNPAAAGWCDGCSQAYLSASWPAPTLANRYLRDQCYECASNHRKEPSTYPLRIAPTA